MGLDVASQLDAIHEALGLCPQHNILFDELTCEEHLQLFGVFKGVPARELPAAVDRMIRQVGLVEKRRVHSKNLSGGMKRKLSVGIALLGDSQVVFLDEPTSGMDPHSRR
jgi:ATP-binding cassette subfamily A (ABC1) protein 3